MIEKHGECTHIPFKRHKHTVKLLVSKHIQSIPWDSSNRQKRNLEISPKPGCKQLHTKIKARNKVTIWIRGCNWKMKISPVVILAYDSALTCFIILPLKYFYRLQSYAPEKKYWHPPKISPRMFIMLNNQSSRMQTCLKFRTRILTKAGPASLGTVASQSSR